MKRDHRLPDEPIGQPLAGYETPEDPTGKDGIVEGLIASATSAALDDVLARRSRPLDSVCPIVFVDALVVKVPEESVVRNKSVHLGIGVMVHGTREVLGIWIEPTEGANLGLKVMNELETRGDQDVLVVCCDGLKGFPEAAVRTCAVHMIRSSLRFVSYRRPAARPPRPRSPPTRRSGNGATR